MARIPTEAESDDYLRNLLAEEREELFATPFATINSTLFQNFEEGVGRKLTAQQQYRLVEAYLTYLRRTRARTFKPEMKLIKRHAQCLHRASVDFRRLLEEELSRFGNLQGMKAAGALRKLASCASAPTEYLESLRYLRSQRNWLPDVLWAIELANDVRRVPLESTATLNDFILNMRRREKKFEKLLASWSRCFGIRRGAPPNVDFADLVGALADLWDASSGRPATSSWNSTTARTTGFGAFLEKVWESLPAKMHEFGKPLRHAATTEALIRSAQVALKERRERARNLET